MRMCYSDPPYIGQAKRHYAKHPDYAGEVDHKALIERMMDEFRDGWALSCSSPSLKIILPMCPEKTRVMAFARTDASFKPGVWPFYSWEPVLLFGGRSHYKEGKMAPIDHFVGKGAHAGFHNFTGKKPPAFCWWVFDCLGLLPDDDFVDLFPGSGAVERAWQSYRLGIIPEAKAPTSEQLELR